MDNIQDLLPKKITSELGLGSLKQALKETHQPKKESLDLETLSPAKKRLVTEELIANQIGMRQIKRASKNQSAIALNKTTIKQRLISGLPFELTESQKKLRERFALIYRLHSQ